MRCIGLIDNGCSKLLMRGGTIRKKRHSKWGNQTLWKTCKNSIDGAAQIIGKITRLVQLQNTSSSAKSGVCS